MASAPPVILYRSRNPPISQSGNLSAASGLPPALFPPISDALGQPSLATIGGLPPPKIHQDAGPNRREALSNPQSSAPLLGSWAQLLRSSTTSKSSMAASRSGSPPPISIGGGPSRSHLSRESGLCAADQDRQGENTKGGNIRAELAIEARRSRVDAMTGMSGRWTRQICGPAACS